jgi:hypothetical protein
VSIAVSADTCTIRVAGNNVASGSAVAAVGSDVNVTDCAFEGNVGYYGAAISVENGNLVVRGSTWVQP